MGPLIKMGIQPAGVSMKTFLRFSVYFREEGLEKIHFKEAEEREENIAGMHICMYVWMDGRMYIVFHSLNIMLICTIRSAFSNKAWHNVSSSS